MWKVSITCGSSSLPPYAYRKIQTETAEFLEWFKKRYCWQLICPLFCVQHFFNPFSLPPEKLTEVASGRRTLHVNRGWGENSVQTQIVSLTNGDSGIKQQSWLLRTVWRWGKRCDCNTLWFWENNLTEVDELGGNKSQSVCSLAHILLSRQALRTLAKNITFHTQIPRLFHAEEETCSPVKHMFWEKCALCVWQQWQSIYLYAEKEMTIIFSYVFGKEHWYSQFFISCARWDSWFPVVLGTARE